MPAERGFTLLEVVVALVIAAAALGIMFRVAGEGLTSVRAADGYQDAVSRAKSHLAAVGRDAALLEGESEGDDGGGYAWHLRIAPLAAAGADKGPQLVGGEQAARQLVLYTVEVTVSWRDQTRQREVTLRTERLAQRSPQ
jgi:general secretion pathway protein I